MEDRADPHIAQAKAAIARVAQAHQAATDAIEAADDLRGAFDLATELAALHGKCEQLTAQVRAQIAVKIHHGRNLTLAQLAEELGKSRSYAQDLVERGTGRGRRAGRPKPVDE